MCRLRGEQDRLVRHSMLAHINGVQGVRIMTSLGLEGTQPFWSCSLTGQVAHILSLHHSPGPPDLVFP
ncbi:hypothetical protein SCLCIDRAFT_339535 [Scleroderma citrinum Foug A]|uniref:Uncharacterized protein n=1 Tax=Scleroderma citrinum Foug A TaxID=1036808 RepID=A0A0C2YZ10_9AGAM|nr:hypothetical protein SCLCIDRAFT_339535 [Scleroderma citrinum Foug A]